MNGERNWISTAAIFNEPYTILIESIAPVINDSLEGTLVWSLFSEHLAFRMFDNLGLLRQIGSNEAVRHCSHSWRAHALAEFRRPPVSLVPLRCKAVGRLPVEVSLAPPE